MERKTFQSEGGLKLAQQGDDTFTVDGLAIDWNRDLGGDRAVRGSFAKTLETRLPRNRIKVYRVHDVAIGIPKSLKETRSGLEISASCAAERGTATKRSTW